MRKRTGRASVPPKTVASCRSRTCSLTAVTRACALVLALATVWLVFDPAPLMAKKKKPPTSKTVRGQVFNASGNGIVGAAVEMTDLTTHKTSAIYTGTGGQFLFTGLSLNQDYQFRAHYKGQSSEVRKVSSWDTRTDLVLNLHIPPPKD